MTKAISYLLFACLFIFMISCEDYKDCNSPVETSLGLGFYHVIDEEETDSILPAITFYALKKPDSLLLLNIAAQRIFVPLNPHTQRTRYYICPDSTLSDGDTISIQYNSELHFVSAGCGFTNYYKLDTVTATKHYIDSIALTNNKINTTNATNVKIYY